MQTLLRFRRVRQLAARWRCSLPAVRTMVVLALCSTALCSGPAWAQEDPPGRVGRLAALHGDVWVFETDPGEWTVAPRNRPVTTGDRLASAPGAGATLQIGSTTLFLGGSSELEVLQLDDQAMRFRLEQGSLALQVRSAEAAAELMVANFEGRFVPLQPGLYRIDRFDERSEAAVWRGALQYESPDLQRVLQADQRARFWQDGEPLATRGVWLTPLDDAFSQTVLSQDRAEPGPALAQFVPPEMTGVEDLQRHGQWQQHPEHGAVWSPTVVSAGWAPYRNGQWVWLRPWGWTWVDAAPWGFAPFHYGRWFWWGSRWYWSPGPVGRRPVFAPALVSWTGGGPAGNPMIGWVPLAPREVYRPPYRASPGHVNRLNPHAPLLRPPPPGYGNHRVPGAVTLLPAPALAPRRHVPDAVYRDGKTPQRPWSADAFQSQAPARPFWPQREQISPRSPSPVWAPPRSDGKRVPGGERPPARPSPGPVTGPAAMPAPGGMPMPSSDPARLVPPTAIGPSQRAPIDARTLPAPLPPIAAQPGPDVVPRRPPGRLAEPMAPSANPPGAVPAEGRPRAAPLGGPFGGPLGGTPRTGRPAGTPVPAGPVPPTAAAPVAAPAPAPPQRPVPVAPVVPAAPPVTPQARPAPVGVVPQAAVPAGPQPVVAPRTEPPGAATGRAAGDAGERRRTPDSRQRQIER